MTDEGLYANITIPIMEDLHLRKFPPIDAAHSHLDFTCLRNSANLSTEQQVLQHCSRIISYQLLLQHAYIQWQSSSVCLPLCSVCLSVCRTCDLCPTG